MSRRNIALVSIAVALFQTCGALSAQSDRRSFLTLTAGTASSLAFFDVAQQHDSFCQCAGCNKFGVQPAGAFYEREAGDETSSALTKALNAQAKETNARLEASGFPLDTKEDEDVRISDAFKSFSYDTSLGGDSKKQGKNVGRGYTSAKKDSSETVKK